MAWLSGWAKRIKISTDADVIDALLESFPVPVYISAASGIGDVDASCVFDELTSDANRKKIAVTTSDGETQCYVEIQRWDDANEQAWLHVKLPSVSESADTDLYLYYDSSQADNTTYVGDTTDAAAQSVWDSDFKAVWGMEQDPSGSAPQIKDSTSNAHHGTSNGTMTSGDLVDATFGKGIDFDGSDDFISFPTNVDDFAFGAGDFTIEVLLHSVGGAGIDGIYACPKENGGTFAKNTIYVSVNASNGIEFVASNGTGWAVNINTSVVNMRDGNPHYLVVYRSGTSWKVFVDLTERGTATVSTTINNPDGDYLRIGNHPEQGKFSGKIGDCRVTKGLARSAAWLKATYHGLFDSLLTFGAEENAYENSITEQFLFIATISGKATFSSSTVEQFALSDIITSELTEGMGRVSISESFYLSDSISLRVYHAARLCSPDSVTISVTPIGGPSSAVRARSAPTVSVRPKSAVSTTFS